jgi:hypothetical protein
MMNERQVKIWTWVSRVLQLLGLLAGVLASADKLPPWVQEHAALAVALLAVAVGWVNGLLPAKPSKILPAVALGLLALVMMLSAGCGNGLANAYRTHGLLVIAGNATGKTMAAVCRAKRQDCMAEYHKSVELNPGSASAASTTARQCMAACKRALHHWTQHGRPGLNAGLSLYWASLETARIAKSKKVSIPDKAKPLLCGLFRAADELRHLFGEALKSILLPVIGLKGLVCK